MGREGPLALPELGFEDVRQVFEHLAQGLVLIPGSLQLEAETSDRLAGITVRGGHVRLPVVGRGGIGSGDALENTKLGPQGLMRLGGTHLPVRRS